MWPKPEPPAEGQQRDLCRFVKITLGLLIRFILAIALNGRNRRSDPSMTDKYWGSDCTHLSHERKRLYNRHRPRRRRPPQRNRDREHQVVTGARAGVVGRPPRVGHLASEILQLLLQRARVGKRSRDLQLASVQTRA